MKDYYKIKEISQLYGIGPDSLRYYEEIGILHPKRGENGYRLYGINDLYKLNVIADLRQLGFNMQQIKLYLDEKTFESTLELLREQEARIEKEIKRLRSRKKTIHSRVEELLGYACVEVGEMRNIILPNRPCVTLRVDARRDEEIDFALNRLHRRFEHKLYMIDNYMIGAAQRIDDIERGMKGLFRSVFFILPESEKNYDFAIPGGQYLSLHYKGSYRQSDQRITEVLSYARGKGYSLLGDVLELYKIDIHETNDSSSFLTEVQVRIGVQS